MITVYCRDCRFWVFIDNYTEIGRCIIPDDSGQDGILNATAKACKEFYKVNGNQSTLDALPTPADNGSSGTPKASKDDSFKGGLPR